MIFNSIILGSIVLGLVLATLAPFLAPFYQRRLRRRIAAVIEQREELKARKFYRWEERKLPDLEKRQAFLEAQLERSEKGRVWTIVRSLAAISVLCVGIASYLLHR